MKKRVFGFACFCVGCGMVMAVVVPALGWVFLTAAIFLFLGYILICS
ncbi:MAG: hypothetical protein ACRCW2_07740 [Cellulosilyticaceae bacterium]